MSARTKSFFNAGGFQIGSIVKPDEKIALKVSYNFFIGPLSVHITNSPADTITQFFTPLLMFNGIALECNYTVDEDIDLFVIGALSTSQNIKMLSVKAPASINAMISKQHVPLFRAQFATLVIGAHWKF